MPENRGGCINKKTQRLNEPRLALLIYGNNIFIDGDLPLEVLTGYHRADLLIEKWEEKQRFFLECQARATGS